MGDPPPPNTGGGGHPISAPSRGRTLLLQFWLTCTITMTYTYAGPASVTLYPKFVGKLRVLIYNGDSDACVPYKGNEEWTEGLAAAGDIVQNKAWHPWFTDRVKNMPAGYSTTYTVPNSEMDFSFVTIRLAGMTCFHIYIYIVVKIVIYIKATLPRQL